jgi:hypothetical protein
VNTFLATIAAVAGLVLLVPLCIWGATGSWRNALHGLIEYVLAMAVLTVPALLLALLAILIERI